MNHQFYKDLKIVESAMRDADYDPYDQLYGFWITGNSAYITRKNNARSIAEKLDRELLGAYLKHPRASHRRI